jgi:hypothetical protein
MGPGQRLAHAGGSAAERDRPGSIDPGFPKRKKEREGVGRWRARGPPPGAYEIPWAAFACSLSASSVGNVWWQTEHSFVVDVPVHG